MKVIVMTGGGSSGHVTPNIALMPRLEQLGYSIHYIGSKNGMEKQLIENLGVPYHSINSGKLRRYIDIKNITDLFRILDGLRQSISVLRKLKPKVVFSKGGFVSCPVVWAAWFCRIPVVIHESDMTPGLANRLSIPAASKICYTFPESKEHISAEKGILTGLPIRKSLLSGDKSIGLKACGFSDKKPVVLIIGGSQGSENINKVIKKGLNSLLVDYQICHICGKNNVDPSLKSLSSYSQFEYIDEEIPHFLAMADIIVSRAGATTLFEMLALQKPNILIPLSKKASRGDQILNAESFEKQGFSYVISEENFDEKALTEGIMEVYSTRAKYVNAMKSCNVVDSIDSIVKIIELLTLKR